MDDTIANNNNDALLDLQGYAPSLEYRHNVLSNEILMNNYGAKLLRQMASSAGATDAQRKRLELRASDYDKKSNNLFNLLLQERMQTNTINNKEQ